MEILLEKHFWSAILASIGSFIGWFEGGWDGFFIALVTFMVVDFITGVMCAFVDKDISSFKAIRGALQKIYRLLIVGLAHILDFYVIGEGRIARTATIFFFIGGEGISVLENAARIGVPVPDKIKEALEQLHGRWRDGEKGGKQ